MKIIVSLLILFVICTWAREGTDAPTGRKILVVVENLNIKSTHSLFFKFLEEKSYQLKFATTEEPIEFQKYGKWVYDHLILFTPSADEINGLKADKISEFVDDGHSVLVAVDSTVGHLIREFASECNVEFDAAETSVLDHFHYDETDSQGPHTLLVVDQPHDVEVLNGKDNKNPILFRGIGADMVEDSILVYPLLSGYQSTYSHNPTSVVKDTHVVGRKTSLVTALQARNNARVIFSGSIEMFGDKFFTAKAHKHGSKEFFPSGNAKFCEEITLWAFQERGILRYSNITHHKVGETHESETYTVNDEIVYSIVIEEWNGRRWIPYIADDVQIEYSMLDPYIRSALKPNQKGVYTVQTKLPDVYGVFTFRVDYVKKGYGFFTAISRVPVRPYRHNQFERFIDAAFPYYVASFSMLAGLFLFSWVFLFHRESK